MQSPALWPAQAAALEALPAANLMVPLVEILCERHKGRVIGAVGDYYKVESDETSRRLVLPGVLRGQRKTTNEYRLEQSRESDQRVELDDQFLALVDGGPRGGVDLWCHTGHHVLRVEVGQIQAATRTARRQGELKQIRPIGTHTGGHRATLADN